MTDIFSGAGRKGKNQVCPLSDQSNPLVCDVVYRREEKVSLVLNYDLDLLTRIHDQEVDLLYTNLKTLVSPVYFYIDTMYHLDIYDTRLIRL